MIMYAEKLKRRARENPGMIGRDPAEPRTDARPRDEVTDAEALAGREREALETMETITPDVDALGTLDTVTPDVPGRPSPSGVQWLIGLSSVMP